MPDENMGTTLSDADIQTAVKAASDQSGQEPTPLATETDQALADVEAVVAGEPAGEAGEAEGTPPAPEPAQPASQPPAQPKAPEPSGTQEPARTPVPTIWDHDRQKRDQEHANAMKAKDAEIEALKARLAAPAAPATPPPAQPPAPAPDADLDKIEARIEATTKQLDKYAADGEATAEDFAKSTKDLAGSLKAIVASLKNAKSGGSDAGRVEQLTQRVEQLVAQQQADAQARTAAEQQNELSRAQSEFEAEVAKLDAEFAPQLHNAAMGLFGQMYQADGYGEDNRIPLPTAKRYIRQAFEQAAREHPELAPGKKPAPPRPSRPAGIRPDPGTGGGAQAAPRNGRLKDVAADMLRSGKFKP